MSKNNKIYSSIWNNSRYCKINSSEKILTSKYCIGTIVKITPARPRNKRWAKKRYNGYYRIIASDEKTAVIQDAAVNPKTEDYELAKQAVYGFRTSDLYDLQNFIVEAFPQMLDEFIEKYKERVHPKSPNYNKVLNSVNNLSEFLKANIDLDSLDLVSSDPDFYKKQEDRAKEVWKNFGSVFYDLWI